MHQNRAWLEGTGTAFCQKEADAINARAPDAERAPVSDICGEAILGGDEPPLIPSDGAEEEEGATGNLIEN